jgi:hypothetical protein
MEIELKREPSGPACTFGKLYVDGVYQAESLEDVVREVKIKGETAIPAGRYRVIVNHSQRFGRELPLLLKVEGFEGVRIHPGNTAANTSGCILVGTERGPDSVLHSRDAFNELFVEIQAAIAGGEEVWISVA